MRGHSKDTTAMSTSDTDLPSEIGRYQVLEHAGEGAMADIYRAHDPDIDRINPGINRCKHSGG